MPESKLPARIESELASLLKARREELGLSKVATGQRAGVSTMTVFFVEEGRRSPSIITLLRLATALEVDLWALLRVATVVAKGEKSNPGFGPRTGQK